MKAGLAALVLVATVAAAFRAQAQSSTSCLDSYEQAQVQRKRHALRAARDAAIACAARDCPTALARECASWLGEIEQAVPTVVFVATASGTEVTDVRVSSNGKLIAERLEGSATFVDPGPQVFRFERAGRTVELPLVVREGEKSRRVSVDFGDHGRRVPRAALVFGGVALAAAAAGVVFELRGFAQKRELDASDCKPRCDPEAVNEMHRSLVVGDLLLVGAGVATAAAVTIAVLGGRETPTAAPMSLTLAPGGFALRGRF